MGQKNRLWGDFSNHFKDISKSLTTVELTLILAFIFLHKISILMFNWYSIQFLDIYYFIRLELIFRFRQLSFETTVLSPTSPLTFCLFTSEFLYASALDVRFSHLKFQRYFLALFTIITLQFGFSSQHCITKFQILTFQIPLLGLLFECR